jgi:hypothetical protein
MDARRWHEAYEHVEQRILLNLQKLREHHEEMREAIRDAERRRSQVWDSPQQ